MDQLRTAELRQPDLDGETWRCMVCRRSDRTFHQISVQHRPPDPKYGDVVGHINVAYCNDNPNCTALARAPGPWLGSPLTRLDEGTDTDGSDGDVYLYMVTTRPADIPDAPYVVRRWAVTAAAGVGEPTPTPRPEPLAVAVAQTLAEARALIPGRADVCQPRSVDDDPAIVEIWL